MRRLIVSLVALVAVFLLLGRDVEAGTGTTTDPADDVFDQQAQAMGPGRLDIVSVTHSDDGARASYSIELKQGFVDADLHRVDVAIDGLPGIEQYDCQQISASVARGPSGLSGAVKHCLGSGSGPEGGPGGFRELGSLTYEHVPGSATIELSFDLAVLRDAGFTGDRYAYRVLVVEAGVSRQDAVPNDGGTVEHLLSPVPTPAVEPPPPPPAPEPTPESTPSMVVTASNPTPTPDLGFAVPEEASPEGRFPVVPLAAGGGAALAGAALVIARLRPF